MNVKQSYIVNFTVLDTNTYNNVYIGCLPIDNKFSSAKEFYNVMRDKLPEMYRDKNVYRLLITSIIELKF